MIELYYWPTPNGHKISIMLEECGLEYEVRAVDIGAGDQFAPEFLAMKVGRFLSISLRRPAGFCRPIQHNDSMYSNGCSGRRVDSVRWQDNSAIS
jgi:hypothetical protein